MRVVSKLSVAEGKKYQKGLEVTLPGAYTGPRIVPVSIRQAGKPHKSGALSTQKDLASLVGNIPRLSAAPVSNNKP